MSTATATMAALAAGWFALLGLQRERDRDAERNDQAIRAQAERVSAYWETPRGQAPQVVVGNLSDQPITATSVYYLDERGKEVCQFLGEHEVRDWAVYTFESLAVVPPQSRTVARMQEVPSELSESVELDEFPSRPRFGVRFTDASGWRRWHRHPDGRLAWENKPPERKFWQLIRQRTALRG